MEPRLLIVEDLTPPKLEESLRRLCADSVRASESSVLIRVLEATETKPTLAEADMLLKQYKEKFPSAFESVSAEADMQRMVGHTDTSIAPAVSQFDATSRQLSSFSQDRSRRRSSGLGTVSLLAAIVGMSALASVPVAYSTCYPRLFDEETTEETKQKLARAKFEAGAERARKAEEKRARKAQRKANQ